MDHITILIAFVLLVGKIACHSTCQCSCSCGGTPSPYGCVVNARNPSTVGAPKKIITGINGPHNILITKSKDVYITGYFDGFVYRLDLAGNIREKFKLPAGNPCMLDIRGDTLFVTNVAKTVYSKELIGNKPFRIYLNNQNRPVGFRISEDGTRVYASEWQTGIVRVYDSKLKPVCTIRLPSYDRYPRKILFDTNGNVNIPGYSCRIHVYTKNCKFIRTITYSGVKHIDGFVNNCDGSRVLADRGGQVVFIDKNGKKVKSIRGYGMSQPTDVAIAPDSGRTLWVADVIGRKVFLF